MSTTVIPVENRCEIRDLDRNTKYEIYVIPYNNNVVGPRSKIISVTMDEGKCVRFKYMIPYNVFNVFNDIYFVTRRHTRTRINTYM